MNTIRPPHQRRRTINRRTFLKASAVGGAALMTGCRKSAQVAGPRTIKLGYVSPQTGPLAPFAEADEFVIAGVRKALAGGLQLGGKSHPVEIIVKNSQSDPNRAAEVTNELILSDEVDMVLVASTPETTNPVSDQCEIGEVPCVSTVAPWQSWFFTRGGDPAQGFDYTYHFFWGLEDIIAVFTDMWSQLETNKVVAGLFPNDGDGNAWADAKNGFPPALEKQGFRLIDPGRYQNLTDDFSAQITAFKSDSADIVTGVVIPPDFTTFWAQAKQQGFAPKAASIGKALLFPVAVEALGEAANNLSTEIWWSPNHPYTSSLSGQASSALASEYTKSTSKQWTQPIGFIHALFEVAVDVLKRSAEIGNAKATLDALAKTDMRTVVGPLSWGKGPVKNVAKTPLVGGQWRSGGDFKYDLVITSNKSAPDIAATSKMEPLA